MEKESLSPDSILRESEKILSELFPQGHPTGALHLDDTLETSLSLDSLARVEFLSRIEEKFHCHFSEEDILKIETLRDLYSKLQEIQGMETSALKKEREQKELRGTETMPSKFNSLLEVLDWHNEKHSELVQVRFYEESDANPTLTYGDLASEAKKIAAGLQKMGVRKNDKIVLMLPTGKEYLCSFFGVLYTGAVPVPIYPLARPQQLEEHIRRHQYILSNCGAVILITPSEIKPLARLLKLQTPSLKHIVSTEELSQNSSAFEPLKILPSDLGLIQYTSGSTGQPKGVMLTHENLLTNIQTMGKALQVNPQDVVVSWLPLYHDMGLIGAWLGSLYFNIPLILMSPLQFLTKPERWLWTIHRYQGTISAAPNFAYELCLRRIKKENLQDLNLYSLRALLNGAEAVGPETVERFIEQFSPFGFKKEALMPVYGLAECCVGLCFPPIGRGPLIDQIERESYMKQGQVQHLQRPSTGSLRFVSCGAPLSSHHIRVVDSFQHELSEDQEGEIQFRGPSATRGYYENPEQNRKLFRGLWLTTGDRGYLSAGELFITGRDKDIIIRGGQHIYPQEIESAVGDLPEVRKGRVVAFGGVDAQSGTERLVVVAETHEKKAAQQQEIREKINQICVELTGTPAEDVVLASPGAILKTSSGKLRRSATRELYEQGRLGLPPRALWAQITSLTAQGIQKKIRRIAGAAWSQVYALYCWALLAIFAPIAWLAVLVLPSVGLRWALSRRMAQLLFKMAFIRIQVFGDLSPLKKPMTQIVACNHSSYIDSLVLMTLLPRPIAFIAKRELEKIPFLSLALKRLGVEFIDRFQMAKSLQDTKSIESRLEKNQSLLFFPEGTFVRVPGLLPFHTGAFLLAARREIPLIPLALKGTRNILRSDSWFPRPGAIEVYAGNPILPSDIPGRDTWDSWRKAEYLKHASQMFIEEHSGETITPERRILS